MNYRIVVDTNVIVSAVLNPRGKPASVIDTVIEGDCLLILSAAILDEVRRVFSYGKIKKICLKNGISHPEINAFVETLSDISLLVSGELELDIIKADPADNIFLACAVEGKADFLVTGDHHLSDLGAYHTIQILAPADFLLHL